MITQIEIIGDGLFRWSGNPGDCFLEGGCDKPRTEAFVIFKASDTGRLLPFYVVTDGDELYEVEPVNALNSAFTLKHKVPLAWHPPLMINGYRLDGGDVSFIYKWLDEFFNPMVFG